MTWTTLAAFLGALTGAVLRKAVEHRLRHLRARLDVYKWGRAHRMGWISCGECGKAFGKVT